MPGFTEPLNNLAPVARSSPRRADSVPSPYMAGNHVSFFGNIFRQIIPLCIRHTPMPGTILSLQAPRVHTSGVSGPQPQAASNRIARAEEAVLGASFNAQSQAPDIPGASSRAASLRAYMEELSASSNAQHQALMIPKLRMILTSRIVSVRHVFSMIIFAKAAKCLQVSSRSKMSSTFSFN